jgi:hypothetical protein
LVRETQLFLDGSYLEVAFCDAIDIPAWAWLSVLAHGDQGSLERAMSWLASHEGARPEFNAWGRVLEHLARQILDTARAIDYPLHKLQRDLLVPLLLTIITTPVGPATLCRLVSSMMIEVEAKSSLG